MPRTRLQTKPRLLRSQKAKKEDEVRRKRPEPVEPETSDGSMLEPSIEKRGGSVLEEKRGATKSYPKRAYTSRFNAPPVPNVVQYHKFCITRTDFNEVYGLSTEGIDPRSFSVNDFSDEDWLTVFSQLHIKGQKVKLKYVRPHLYQDICQLHQKVYQEPPFNGECSLHLARGFALENCARAQSADDRRGFVVAWAVLGESVIEFVRKCGNLNAKIEKWTKMGLFHSVKQEYPTGSSLIAAAKSQVSHGVNNIRLSPSLPMGPLDKEQIVCRMKIMESHCRSVMAEKKRDLDGLQIEAGKLRVVLKANQQLAAVVKRNEMQMEEARELLDATPESDIATRLRLELKIELYRENIQQMLTDTPDENGLARVEDSISKLKMSIEDTRQNLHFIEKLFSDVHSKYPVAYINPPQVVDLPDNVNGMFISYYCTACGCPLRDKELLQISILADCGHSYHSFCISLVATNRSTCIRRNCGSKLPSSLLQAFQLPRANITGNSSDMKEKEADEQVVEPYIPQFADVEVSSTSDDGSKSTSDMAVGVGTTTGDDLLGDVDVVTTGDQQSSDTTMVVDNGAEEVQNIHEEVDNIPEEQVEDGVEEHVEDGAEEQVEQGAEEQAEQGAEEQLERGAQEQAEQVEHAAEVQLENGADEEVENGADEELENGADEEVDNGAEQVDNGAEIQVENGVAEEVDNGAEHVDNGAEIQVENGVAEEVDNGVAEEFVMEPPMREPPTVGPENVHMLLDTHIPGDPVSKEIDELILNLCGDIVAEEHLLNDGSDSPDVTLAELMSRGAKLRKKAKGKEPKAKGGKSRERATREGKVRASKRKKLFDANE